MFLGLDYLLLTKHIGSPTIKDFLVSNAILKEGKHGVKYCVWENAVI